MMLALRKRRWQVLIAQSPVFRPIPLKDYVTVRKSDGEHRKFSKSHDQSQDKFLELMFLKNSFGIPRRAQVVLCWLHLRISVREKGARTCETRRVRVCAEESTLSYSLPLPSLFLSFSCVFYCKLRLKSMARSQAFHLGRCIPADTHERYMLAYVSRVRARERASRSCIREEKSSYVLPAGSEVRFTCTYMIHA